VSTSGKPLETEGETIDEAIDNALAELAISREQAEVEVLQDARRGVFGFGGQPARVRVSVREAVVVDPLAAVPSMPQPRATVGVIGDDAVRVLTRLLELMGFGAKVDVVGGDESGEVCLRISSEAGGLLIGRHGQTLDALEYLLNRLVERKDERIRRLLLDSEGYRERRRRELIETARRLAARVRETGRPVAMNPSNARERRIVHLALADDTRLSTRSDGEGSFRHVVIVPRRPGRDGATPRRRPNSSDSSPH
jgi:spoIIIJ-associated protein